MILSDDEGKLPADQVSIPFVGEFEVCDTLTLFSYCSVQLHSGTFLICWSAMADNSQRRKGARNIHYYRTLRASNGDSDILSFTYTFLPILPQSFKKNIQTSLKVQ